MPIYEYSCDCCHSDFELLQPMGAPPPEVCPECGGAGVRKLISATTFVLKGGGWYRDHYGLKGAAATASSSPAGKAETPKSSGEVKAAAK